MASAEHAWTGHLSVGVRAWRLCDHETLIDGVRRPAGKIRMHHARRSSPLLLVLTVHVVVHGGLIHPRALAQDTKPNSTQLVAAAPSASQNEVDRILTALQDRGEALRDIRCRVKFVEDDRVNLTKRIKEGRILLVTGEPNARFLIQFDKTEADGVAGQREWYLFDGRWLSEGVERLEQVTKREMARAGEKVNLFDLETAPFPLPFGQKKEVIRRNFEVSLVPPASGDPSATDHLVCIPKPESKFFGRYDKLEFFVLKDLRLPNRIVVTKNGGLEIETADFPDLSSSSMNVGVAEKEFAPPSEWKKYKVVTEELGSSGEGAP